MDFLQTLLEVFKIVVRALVKFFAETFMTAFAKKWYARKRTTLRHPKPSGPKRSKIR